MLLALVALHGRMTNLPKLRLLLLRLPPPLHPLLLQPPPPHLLPMLLRLPPLRQPLSPTKVILPGC